MWHVAVHVAHTPRLVLPQSTWPSTPTLTLSMCVRVGGAVGTLLVGGEEAWQNQLSLMYAGGCNA